MTISVGINARYLNSPMSGIERYIAELLRHAALSDCVFHPRTVHSWLGRADHPNALLRKLRPFYSAVWDRYMDALEGPQQDIDLFHAPSFIAPKLAKVPTVVTVHDLAFRIYPEFFDLRTKSYYGMFMNASLTQAKRIVCVSEATASDVIRFYPKVKQKVRVVHNGFTDFSRIPPDNKILDTLGLAPDGYLLCVGAFNARKNIQAVLSLAPRLRELYPRMRIVVVGRPAVQQCNLLDASIVFSGHISDAALSSLYRNAALFVYPSKYEGFGFPMLEAMSVGTPVAYSQTSCLPEIAGLDDRHAFDPNRPEDILDTIVGLLKCGRDALDHDRVRTSLARFSWERMSLETIEVYRECLS